MSKWKKKAKRNKKLAKYWMQQATALEADKTTQEDGFTKWRDKLEEHHLEREIALRNEIATLKASSTGDQSEYIKSLQDQINMLLEQIDYLENHTQRLTRILQEDNPVEPQAQSAGAPTWLKTPEEIEELIKKGFVWKATDADGTVCLYMSRPETYSLFRNGTWWALDGCFVEAAYGDFSKPWKESLEYLGPKEKAPEGAPVLDEDAKAVIELLHWEGSRWD